MLVSLKFNNAYAYLSEEIFSLRADLRSKKLSSNVIKSNNTNVVKSACIYGPNNSGKTCLIKILKALRNILLDENRIIHSNIFSDNPIVSVSCRFIEDQSEWEYEFKFNDKTRDFLFEQFSKVILDSYNNEKLEIYFLRDFENKNFVCKDEKLKESILLLSKKNILIHIADTTELKYLDEAKKMLTNFASNLIIIDMNNIPLSHTIQMLKNHDKLQAEIVSFIKNADLYLDDYKYIDNTKIKLVKESDQITEEEVLANRIPKSIEDSLKLVSVYKGKFLPSLLFDSTGTKKIAALASYVVEALKKGQTLIIDELDSSIHFKLTREIVSMFNNVLNDSAQLIFSAHDVSLLDCKKLFRKEQIWFVHKDEKKIYLYPLSSFTAEDGIRADSTDLYDKYKKGILGAIPDPDMIETLLQVKK